MQLQPLSTPPEPVVDHEVEAIAIMMANGHTLAAAILAIVDDEQL